jgi:hypothetical protein
MLAERAQSSIFCKTEALTFYYLLHGQTRRPMDANRIQGNALSNSPIKNMKIQRNATRDPSVSQSLYLEMNEARIHTYIPWIHTCVTNTIGC